MKKIKKWIKNNQVAFVGIILFIILFVMILVFYINRGTYSINTNQIELECSTQKVNSEDIVTDKAIVNKEFSCKVIVYSISEDTISAVKANYSLPSQIEYSRMEFKDKEGTEVCPEDDSGCLVYADEEGFIFATGGTIHGGSDGTMIGTIVFNMSDQAQNETDYYIGLINSQYADKDENIIEIEDLSKKITTLSDDNNLSSLKVNDTTIGISDNSLEYEMNVEDEDEITYALDINSKASVTVCNNMVCTKTKTGEVNLHHGNNDVVITVSSESGKEKIYTIKVNREYNFALADNSPYKYNYSTDSDNNYIYTGSITDETSIKGIELKLSNNDEIDKILKKIENNKLKIYYDDTLLSEVIIKNFSISDYVINDKKIYLKKSTKYSDFISKFTKNNVDVKIFDSEDEITSGIILDGYKVRIYYDNNKYDEYSIVTDNVNINANGNFVVDSVNNYFTDIALGTTFKEIKDCITTGGEITITSSDGKSITDNDKVKTGDKIIISLTNSTLIYTLSVPGDINGDGNLSLIDVILIYNHVAEYSALSGVKEKSADINGDGNLSLVDVGLLYNYVSGGASNE